MLNVKMFFIYKCVLYHRLVQDVCTCMGVSVNVRRKFGVQMTPRLCVICVVEIVLTPPANRKSSSFISHSWTSSKVYSPASNISRQSDGNPSAQPRIGLICAVIVIIFTCCIPYCYNVHLLVYLYSLQMFTIALGGKSCWDLSYSASSLGWDCLCVSTRFPHSTQCAKELRR